MRPAVLIALAAMLAACGAPVTPSTPTPGATTPSASESAAPSEAVTPTRICDGLLAGPNAEGPPITCTEAIGKVLLALGPDAPFVQAAWFRGGAPCPPNARCIAPPLGSAYVVIRLQDGRSGIVRLATEGGEVVVGAPEDPTFDVWPPSGQAIPAVGRPDVGPGAPPEVADREAFPMCGDAQVGQLQRRVGRSCFLGAVQDGRPAELVDRSVDVAGHPVVELYRYAGRGPVLVYRSLVPAGPGWVRSDCAIGLPVEDVPGDDESVFVIQECLSTELT